VRHAISTEVCLRQVGAETRASACPFRVAATGFERGRGKSEYSLTEVMIHVLGANRERRPNSLRVVDLQVILVSPSDACTMSGNEL